MASMGSKILRKLRGAPHPVPDKDDMYLARPYMPYAASSFTQSSLSISNVSLVPEGSSTMHRTDQTPSLSVHEKAAPSRSIKSIQRAIAKMSKRPSFASLATTSTETVPPGDGDVNITLPWNIKHDIHVESKGDGLLGLPPSWSASLEQAGFTQEEIDSMYAEQRKIASPPLPPNKRQIINSIPRKPVRAVPSLPRSVSPAPSSRPYSTISSAKSTFTYAASEFPSELGSVRIKKRGSEDSGRQTPPLPPLPAKYHQSKPNDPSDTSTSDSTPDVVVEKRGDCYPASTSHPPIHMSSAHDGDDADGNDASDDFLGEGERQTPSMLPSTLPVKRLSLTPPMLTLSTVSADDEWTKGLLSSFAAGSPDLSLSSNRNPRASTVSTNTKTSFTSLSSDYRRDTIIAPQPLRLDPSSPSSSVQPNTPHRSARSSASNLSQSTRISSSASSLISQTSSNDVQEAAIETPQLIRKVSIVHKSPAITIAAGQRRPAIPTILLPATSSRALSTTLTPQSQSKFSVAGAVDPSTSTPTIAIIAPTLTIETQPFGSVSSRDGSPPAFTPTVSKHESLSSEGSSVLSLLLPSTTTSPISTDVKEDESAMPHPSNMGIYSAYAEDTYSDDDESHLRPPTATPEMHRPSVTSNSISRSILPRDPLMPISAFPAPPVSPVGAQFIGAGSISGERKGAPSPLGIQKLDLIPDTPTPSSQQTPLKPDGNVNAKGMGSRMSPSPSPGLQGELPPIPLIVHADDVNGFDISPSPNDYDREDVIYKSYYKDELGGELETDRTRIENLFQPLLPYLSVTNPLSRFTDLTQVAEGQFGPVFAARATEGDEPPGLSLSTHTSSRLNTLVAVKLIRVDKENSPKVQALATEASIMGQVRHPHVLATAGLFVQGDTLWVEMELMERSLADMLPFVEEGLIFQEAEVGRFASDVLCGLAYLETLNIAHRDVRSDNLLISRSGVLKLADFSHAILTKSGELCNGIIPVPLYWMAPEMRLGRPYNAHLADVWSVGATIWEVFEGTPPFLDAENSADLGDRWPTLKRNSELSASLHQFLRLCSEADDWRPRADELLETSFVRGACSRNDIVTLLAEVRLMEDGFRGS